MRTTFHSTLFATASSTSLTSLHPLLEGNTRRQPARRFLINSTKNLAVTLCALYRAFQFCTRHWSTGNVKSTAFSFFLGMDVYKFAMLLRILSCHNHDTCYLMQTENSRSAMKHEQLCKWYFSCDASNTCLFFTCDCCADCRWRTVSTVYPQTGWHTRTKLVPCLHYATTCWR